MAIDDLDLDVCWRLVSRARIGRVGFVVDDEPRVRPVNCGVLGRQVVFRTSRDSTLGRLGDLSAVTVEFDDIDPVAESGWSVLVRGRLAEVVDLDDLAHLAVSDLHPWSPGAKDRWMKVVPTAVTGRRVHRRRNLPPGAHVPSMPPG